MEVLKKLNSEEDFSRFVEIVANAYPGSISNKAEEKQRFKEMLMDKQLNDPSVEFYGLFRNDKLIAGMRLHFYEMNLYSQMISIGGVGLVAVDLLHKKEQAAKHLIEQFLLFFKERNIHFLALYPFRPEFYKKMGFGYGPMMYQYYLEPSSFPKGKTKEHLQFASITDLDSIKACYNHYVETHHGMFYKSDAEWNPLFKHPDNRVIMYQKNGVTEGYLVFSFQKLNNTNFLHNKMIIKEWISTTPEALMELSTFIHTQADQIYRVEWNTLEENVRFLVSDPRNGTNELIPSVYHPISTAATGLMYRIIDVKAFFMQMSHKLFSFTPITMKLTVKDSFFQENEVTLALAIKDGFIKIMNEAEVDVEVTIDISELSSLLMGVVSFKELYLFNKLTISDNSYLTTLNNLFLMLEEPICMTAF